MIYEGQVSEYLTDYGAVRLSPAVAESIRSLMMMPEGAIHPAICRFEMGLIRWLQPLYDAGMDAERITIRMSQARKWMRRSPRKGSH